MTLFYLTISAFNILWILFTIVCVEYTLNFNHVQGVLANDGLASAGQLLPLLIGFFSSCRLCWIIYKDRREKRNHEPCGEEVPSLQTNSTKTERIRGLFSIKLRKSKGDILYALLTGWMPWLSCFQFWRELGARQHSSTNTDVARTSSDVEQHRVDVKSEL